METVPIDRLISTKLTYLKKDDKINKEMSDTSRKAKIHKIHKNEELAKEQGIILLDEFEFPHAVFQLNRDELTSTGL